MSNFTHNMNKGPGRRDIRVLVVDDSAFLRHTLSKYLEAEDGITVVGQAVNGLDALAKVHQLRPNVVVLDVEMPRMDGLTALKRIMAECPTPVVMLSALTTRGAHTTVQALMRGAVDFVAKPAVGLNIREVIEELVAKLRVAAETPLPSLPLTAPLVGRAPPSAKPSLRPFLRGDPVIVIGASTGGPRALQKVLSGLPGDLPAAVGVVQHMPPGFTRSLAQRLNEKCALTVEEATSDSRLARGLVLVAPGDYHLRFRTGKRVGLDQGARRNHVRPAADVAMESAADHYGEVVIGVVLTGMGSDGREGSARIKAVGGQVIAEHQSTCAVYGMPRSVIEANLADYVVPLAKVAPTLVKLVEGEE